MRPKFQQRPDFKDVTEPSQPGEGSSYFPFHLQKSRLPRRTLQSMPALPRRASPGTLRGHPFNPQGFSGAPLAPHLPSTHSDLLGSTHTHTPTLGPHSRMSLPGPLHRAPQGPGLPRFSGIIKFSTHFPTLEDSFWKDIPSRKGKPSFRISEVGCWQ